MDPLETIGEVVDTIDNILMNLNNPNMPASINIEGMKGSLPDIRQKLVSFLRDQGYNTEDLDE